MTKQFWLNFTEKDAILILRTGIAANEVPTITEKFSFDLILKKTRIQNY
jgi:hypothetical protein